MAAKVCRSVLLLSRSSGAVAGSLPALVVSPQRHQQHVGPQDVLSATFTRQTVRRAHGQRSAAHSTLFTQPTSALSPQVWSGAPSWHGQRLLCSSTAPEEVTVVYQNGLPVISVSLPSRRERCQFTLKPLSDCVGVFLQQLQAEDRGIDRVAIYSMDGARIASSTGIDILLLDDFKLVINDTTHLVRPPRRDILPHEEAERLNDVKFLVQQLYTTLRIEEHQLSKERELIGRLEDLNSQLRPLEKVKEELSRKAERRTTWVLWGGMAYMATQFGILARLTWWEYSWDIMEPVTYFITYGTAMAMYAYFVLTRQEYVYPDARDRQYLLFLHKGVKRTRFDVEKYNKLKDDIAEVELDLKRLRDPLQLQLPIQQLTETKN
ncbi:calcium uniporter protein, mitochondrial isoform X1 [Kryptolebias marmoratus]|uniref:Calcium uniporter protein n=1 Tax=Kryptolebias marmoratus TaxID=37003 RepID=A0A3Q3AY08_KRYMA|nr:calcium uniporter protein, mitochondrial isoform X1 [Kryptolebias marmoratus]XP_024860965.1 calcium uniporter protein, mitochondrial isoform X1 [Kryptolebias marmoratus]